MIPLKSYTIDMISRMELGETFSVGKCTQCEDELYYFIKNKNIYFRNHTPNTICKATKPIDILMTKKGLNNRITLRKDLREKWGLV